MTVVVQELADFGIAVGNGHACAGTRMRECLSRTAVLTDDFAHHALRVSSSFPYRAR